MTEVLNSIIRLSERLKTIVTNIDACNNLARRYIIIKSSKDDSKKKELASNVISVIKPLYELYRTHILNKDFTFLTTHEFMLDNINISSLYIKIIDSGNLDLVKPVNNELLMLFRSCMNETDKQDVDSKYAKKKVHKSNEGIGFDNIINSIMSKNKDTLKRAENDPAAIANTISSIINNSSGDIGKLAQNLVKQINPRKFK